MKSGKLFCILLALLLCALPCASAQETQPSAEAAQWYEQNAENSVLTVRLPLGDVQNESWHFLIGNERVIELLTCEVVSDEAGESADGAMWVGSFKSFAAEEGRTVLQFTRTDESGAVIEARLLHVAASDTSLRVENAVENSFYHVRDTVLYVSLPANSTTGYSWSHEISDAEILTCTKEAYIPFPSEGMTGTGGTYTAEFEGTFQKAGEVTLTLSYARPWESGAVERHQIRLFVNEANYPELLCGEPSTSFPSGRFGSDEPLTLTLTRNADGTYAAVISIYRLTLQDDGVGVCEGNVLTVTATDAAGNPMVWTIVRENDTLTASVTESTWVYLPVGETFLIDLSR